jgi:threonine dehydrogenase-like Zn-dependent dehydrogenase
LVRAFNGAGFTVCRAESAFDDQYLWAEARVDGQASPIAPPKRPPDVLYRCFSTRFAEKLAGWRQRIDELRSDRRRVVIWGAGAKGVMFLNLLRVTAGAGIDWAVDINPRKQGHFVPLMGQRIVGPDCLLRNPPDLVIVMNAEYECEVRSMIDVMGIDCEVVST